MTTFEHAMLGINGVLATGLYRAHGWQLAALGGVAAVSPDWDGLPIVVSVEWFDRVHRVWGHNIFACILLGAVVGALDYRFDCLTRVARAGTKLLRLTVADAELELRGDRHRRGYWTWIAVGVFAALSQLPADLVVSGTATLNDWELQLFWPLSNRGWVWPLVPWGDIGVTVVFVIGMFAMLRFGKQVQLIAGVTLAFVVFYIALRPLLPG